VASSLDAELSAIFAGIYLSHRAWGDSVRGVVVRTDCQVAIRLLTVESLRQRTLNRNPGAVRLREKILAFAKQHAIELDFRWVKGHQSTNTVQAYLNRACDKLAAPTQSSGSHRASRALAKARNTPPLHGAPPAASTPSAEASAQPRPRSRKEKNRARRARARARKRARKMASDSGG
jgi:ribonuclease HI